MSAFCNACINGRVVSGQAPEIDFFRVIFTNHFERIFEHGHHSQAQQVHFDDPHIGAVFLIPLHHHAARHRRGFQWNHGIQLPLAHHHSAGMLPEMARQILHRLAKLEKFPDAPVLKIEARVAELALERIRWAFVFPRSDQARQMAQRFRIERQSLADFARRRAASIGDHIRRHRRAQFPIALVNILNRAFPLVAAGEIEIDVGPFAALFG